MFIDRLQRIEKRVDGSLALALVASDGIIVESLSRADDLDLEVLAAELVNQLQEISDDSQEVATGQVERFTVTTDQLTVVVSSVSEDYYLLMVLGDDANHGKARFELDRARLLLEEDLV
jgi:predicted regulator of Ras-like GTPase activity (Roadblock/LC7/MglB family)